jgi:hypothetical protein
LTAGLALAVAGPLRARPAAAQCTPDTCDCGNGNGQSGDQGGAGGGAACGGAPATPSHGDSPGNTAGDGGNAGNGGNGANGVNVIITPTPAPTAPPLQGSAGSAGGSTSSGPSSSSTPSGKLDSMAKQTSWSTDEVASWFGTLGPNDSIGGMAQEINVHPDDEVVVYDGRPPADDGGTAQQTGIAAIADSTTKPGQDVDLVLHSDPVPLGTTTTASGGGFSTTVRIPANTSAGKHVIVALAPNAKQGRTAFVYPVNVETAAAPAAVGQIVDSSPTPTAKHFPWLLFEFLVGTASVVTLFVIRVRRAAADA